MRGTFLLALGLLGSYILIKAEASLFSLFSTCNPSCLLSLYPAFKLLYVSGFVSMPSYDFNLLCFAAISLSFLAKHSGCLCDLKHRAMSQCLFGFWLLVYSWLQPFSCIWYSTELYRHFLFICVFCGWWFPLLFCAVRSSCMCKYSSLGCLLVSVIFFHCFPCLYTFFITAFSMFSP